MWCGVVWCGMVWCGVVWCGVVWCGVVWCGVVWFGVVWCGVVLCVTHEQSTVCCQDDSAPLSFHQACGESGTYFLQKGAYSPIA